MGAMNGVRVVVAAGAVQIPPYHEGSKGAKVHKGVLRCWQQDGLALRAKEGSILVNLRGLRAFVAKLT